MRKYTTSILLTLCLAGINHSYAQNFEWVKSFADNYKGLSWFITTDPQGNVYTTGQCNGMIDFDPGPGISNINTDVEGDIYIQKLGPNGDFIWAKTFGSAGIPEIGYSIVTDPSGNTYTMGLFCGTVDFDPGPGTNNATALGNSDIFILKLDPNGTFLWVKSFGGSGSETANSMTLDVLGNIYTTGYFLNTVDFDPGAGISNLSASGFDDAFVQKLDASGNFIWARSFGGSSYVVGNAISTDASGNSYIVGGFYGLADFDPGTVVNNILSSGDQDVFIQKLNSSGNLVWVKSFGGIYTDYSGSIDLDTLGNVYTTGDFMNTVDFDPGVGVTNHSSNGGRDTFVHKLDSSGNFMWVKPFGGTGTEQLVSIGVDISGNVYTHGIFYGTVNFDTDGGSRILTSIGDYDLYIHKLDADGHFIWALSMGGTSLEWSRSITVDDSGSIYTTGFFGNTVDFDPGTGISNVTAVGPNNIYIHKMTQATLGTTELSNGIELIAFPNPSNGIIQLSTKEQLSHVELKLTDIQGKVIQTQSYDQLKSITIELPEANGVYFLHIYTQKGQQTIKLVKE